MIGSDITPAGPPPAGLVAYCSCGAWWTGQSRAHCPADGCHLTFSSDSAAARHRRGRFGVDRRCVPPEDAGLIPAARPYGVLWSMPAADAPHWGPA